MRKTLFLGLLCIAAAAQAQQAVTSLRDSVVARPDTAYRDWTETIPVYTSVPDSAKRIDSVLVEPDTTARGHYIQAYVGLGYGSLGHKMDQGSVNGTVSGLVQIQYAYFFHENWGIGAGLRFANYGATTKLTGDRHWWGVKDTDGETYNHTTKIRSFSEREQSYRLSIPVTMQFMYRWQSGIGLFADLGLAPTFALTNTWKITKADLMHEGDYTPWNLLLWGVHEFTPTAPEDKGKWSSRIGLELLADVGVLIPIYKQLDLFAGVYAGYICTNVSPSERQDLGFQTPSFPFMAPYEGAVATNECSAMHPWAVGIKVGVHWHYVGKPHKKAEEVMDYFNRSDTTYRYVQHRDTVVRMHYDTIQVAVVVPVEPEPEVEPEPVVEQEPEPIAEPARPKAERLQKSEYSVQFKFNQDTLTPWTLRKLDSIAQSLVDNPDQRIAINGHTCIWGDSIYNNDLSLRRAQYVYRRLMKQGVKASQVEVRGFGSTQPLEKAEGQDVDIDRRVEIMVLKNEEEQQ